MKWRIIRLSNGGVKRITFKYPEPHSGHSRAKHSLHDHNNRRHAAIDIADMWRTKWWSNQQHSFFSALSEVSANAFWSLARSQPQEPELEFWRNMAIAMVKNTLDDNGKTVPVRPGGGLWLTKPSVNTKWRQSLYMH